MNGVHYILDTYAWIEYVIGSNKGAVVKALIDDKENTFTTLESSVAELYDWCLKEARDLDELLRIVRAVSSVEPITLHRWLAATQLRLHNKKSVKDFGLMDALLLARQRESKSLIVTGDKHFQHMRNIIFLK